MIPVRRTIPELIARYKLEPGLRDIYVEGSTDKNLLEWFLREHGITDVLAYEVQTVDVPFDEVAAVGEEDNNRGRLVALAHRLMGDCENLRSRVACVADADMNFLFGAPPACDILIFTDYTAVELYCFTERVVGKFLKLVIGDERPADAFLEDLTPVLQDLFLIRATNKVLRLGLREVPFERSCRLKGEDLVFDVDDFLGRYLGSNGRLGARPAFLRRTGELRAGMSGDPRQYIHKDDFTRLVRWLSVQRRKLKAAERPENLTRSLLGCLEAAALAGEGLFAELLRRFPRE